MSRTVAALLAGFIAIAVNSLLLLAADLVPLTTAHGGLLRLLQMMTGLHLPATSAFKWGFHGAVGLGMALVYAYVMEPAFPASAIIKGLLYALVVWCLNSAFVLPLIGEGFAGSQHLTFAGMAWFAGAHTTFFVCLALLYAQFREEARDGSRGIPEETRVQ